jgi:PKD repeat protein
VVYDSPGSYDVTLTVTDVNGTSTRTITNFIRFETFSVTAPMPRQQRIKW